MGQVETAAEEPFGLDGGVSEDEEPNSKGKGLGRDGGLRRLFGPGCASAGDGDPIYCKERSVLPKWPVEITLKGKLRDARYGGYGWPLFFRNPDRTMVPVHLDDFKRVAQHLKDSHGLVFWKIEETSPAVVQMSLGLGRKQGTLQLYLSQFGRMSGNCRLNMGADRVKEVRSILLKSAWFCDACGAGARSVENVAESTFQPGGAILLPQLSNDSYDKDIVAVLKRVHNKLGGAGKAAVTKYLGECGVSSDAPAMAMVKKIFGEGGAKGKEGKEKSSKSKRRKE